MAYVYISKVLNRCPFLRIDDFFLMSKRKSATLTRYLFRRFKNNIDGKTLRSSNGFNRDNNRYKATEFGISVNSCASLGFKNNAFFSSFELLNGVRNKSKCRIVEKKYSSKILIRGRNKYKQQVRNADSSNVVIKSKINKQPKSSQFISKNISTKMSLIDQSIGLNEQVNNDSSSSSSIKPPEILKALDVEAIRKKRLRNKLLKRTSSFNSSSVVTVEDDDFLDVDDAGKNDVISKNNKSDILTKLDVAAIRKRRQNNKRKLSLNKGSSRRDLSSTDDWISHVVDNDCSVSTLPSPNDSVVGIDYDNCCDGTFEDSSVLLLPIIKKTKKKKRKSKKKNKKEKLKQTVSAAKENNGLLDEELNDDSNCGNRDNLFWVSRVITNEQHSSNSLADDSFNSTEIGGKSSQNFSAPFENYEIKKKKSKKRGKNTIHRTTHISRPSKLKDNLENVVSDNKRHWKRLSRTFFSRNKFIGDDASFDGHDNSVKKKSFRKKKRKRNRVKKKNKSSDNRIPGDENTTEQVVNVVSNNNDIDNSCNNDFVNVSDCDDDLKVIDMETDSDSNSNNNNYEEVNYLVRMGLESLPPDHSISDYNNIVLRNNAGNGGAASNFRIGDNNGVFVKGDSSICESTSLNVLPSLLLPLSSSSDFTVDSGVCNFIENSIGSGRMGTIDNESQNEVVSDEQDSSSVKTSSKTVDVKDEHKQSQSLLSQTNSNRITLTQTRSYSDAVKDDTVVNKATSGDSNSDKDVDLEQFLKNVRKEILTPYGKWIKDDSTGRKYETGIFKVMSYNILAQSLLEMHRTYLYRDHEKQYLEWSFRFTALMEELKTLEADILCLQEVDSEHLESISKELSDLGYKGIYKKRTNDKVDGCAIYYRDSMFSLNEYALVEYYQPQHRFLNRDNVGIVARFKMKSCNRNIVVANTHLLFNPRRVDIRLAQIQMLLAEIERIAFCCCDRNGQPKYHPIVLTGDFNSRPFSPVYDFIVEGFLPYDDFEYEQRVQERYRNCQCQFRPVPKDLSITDNCQHAHVITSRRSTRNINDIRHVKLYNSERMGQCNIQPDMFYYRQWDHQTYYEHFNTGRLTHNFRLTSAYPIRRRNHFATTNQEDWCTVDYIFYGPTNISEHGAMVDGNLKLISYQNLPTVFEAEKLKAIPNKVCGSDHLSLMATFHLPETNP